MKLYRELCSMRDFFDTINSFIDITYNYATVKELTDKFVLKVEVPGATEEEVNITFEGGTVIIKYPRGDPKDIYNFSSYISENVDEDNINATLKNGILELSFPKKDKSSVKTIKISKS